MPELAEFEVGLATLFVQHTSASLTINENASSGAAAAAEGGRCLGAEQRRRCASLHALRRAALPSPTRPRDPSRPRVAPQTCPWTWRTRWTGWHPRAARSSTGMMMRGLTICEGAGGRAADGRTLAGRAASPRCRGMLCHWPREAAAQGWRASRSEPAACCLAPPPLRPAHVKSSLMGASLTVPVQHGRLAMGTWQARGGRGGGAAAGGAAGARRLWRPSHPLRPTLARCLLPCLPRPAPRACI